MKKQKLQDLLAKTSNLALKQKLEEAIRKLEKDEKSEEKSRNLPKNKDVYNYTYTGNSQTFKVPVGITSISIDAYGASSMMISETSVSYNDNAYLGKGGRVQTELNVTAGQTLNIYVGGTPDTFIGYGVVEGGWNGGGNGPPNHHIGIGFPGGGATDIRIGGTELNNRVIVAGGGGGQMNGDGGRCDTSIFLLSESCMTLGGHGGGLNGQDGISHKLPGTYDTKWVGKGGSQSLGGAGGEGYEVNVEVGRGRGDAGQRGKGGTSSGGMGGGGGGGFWGGGGGGNDSNTGYGGGGGSSYTDPNLCSKVVHTQGVQTGSGRLTITVTQPVDGPDVIRPFITVNTGNDKVRQGSIWTDAGAKADTGEQVFSDASSDLLDGRAEPGIYTVTYTATDIPGNVGTATRTVTVEISTLPLDGTLVQWAHTDGTSDKKIYFDLANKIRLEVPKGYEIVLLTTWNGSNYKTYSTDKEEIEDVHNFIMNTQKTGSGFAGLAYSSKHNPECFESECDPETVVAGWSHRVLQFNAFARETDTGKANRDDCEVPYGDNSTCTDCCGVLHGDNSTCVDCAGSCPTDINYGATDDDCGVCSGGNTVHVANSDKDCAGVCNGNATDDDCGVCSGGNTVHVANSDKDCAGVCNGNATLDCNGDCNGSATDDDCGVCSGGNTDHVANSDKDCANTCPPLYYYRVKYYTENNDNKNLTLKEIEMYDIEGQIIASDTFQADQHFSTKNSGTSYTANNGNLTATSTSILTWDPNKSGAINSWGPHKLINNHIQSVDEEKTGWSPYSQGNSDFHSIAHTNEYAQGERPIWYKFPTEEFTVTTNNPIYLTKIIIYPRTFQLQQLSLQVGTKIKVFRGDTLENINTEIYSYTTVETDVTPANYKGIKLIQGENGVDFRAAPNDNKYGALLDDCGVCSGGTTNVSVDSTKDCHGDCNGTASFDDCGVCTGGNTGIQANDKDCNGECKYLPGLQMDFVITQSSNDPRWSVEKINITESHNSDSIKTSHNINVLGSTTIPLNNLNYGKNIVRFANKGFLGDKKEGGGNYNYTGTNTWDVYQIEVKDGYGNNIEIKSLTESDEHGGGGSLYYLIDGDNTTLWCYPTNNRPENDLVGVNPDGELLEEYAKEDHQWAEFEIFVPYSGRLDNPDFGALLDDCDVCYGGNTNVSVDSTKDCNGDCNGEASIDECNVCSGGNTNLVHNESCLDKCGVPNGNGPSGCDDECFSIKKLDECEVCDGHNDCDDCMGVQIAELTGGDNNLPGQARLDNCRVCYGGTSDVQVSYCFM